MKTKRLIELLDCWSAARDKRWRAQMTDDALVHRRETAEAVADMAAVEEEIERRIGEKGEGR